MSESLQVQVGDPVYVRAKCTRRAALAEMRYVVPTGDSYVVRLVTDWYDWDSQYDNVLRRKPPKAGEVVTVRGYVLEAVRE